MKAYKITIIAWFVLMVTMPGVCRVNIRYCYALKGQIPENPDIKTASFEQAAALLTNRDVYVAMSAARRIGAIDGHESLKLDILVTTFWQIAYYKMSSREDLPSARKMDIIRVIGRLQKREAGQALLAIAQSYWAAGPRTNTSGLTDYEFIRVIVLTAHELERWAGEDSIHEYAKSVIGDPEFCSRLKKYDDRAYLIKLYEAGEMKRNGNVDVTKIAEQAAGKLGELNDRSSKGDKTVSDDVRLAMVLLINDIPIDAKSNLYRKAESDYHAANREAIDVMCQASRTGWTDELHKKNGDARFKVMRSVILMDNLSSGRPSGIPECLPLDQPLQ